ncbi:DUF397 domain-containing protein [Nocardiopsis dassonvillei]|uniref:DUF397 domain-containing protein n=1 Tax=Nocardiopsis dassonvillei TaxID=2014 RepID=UPI000B9D6231|nr:DUF397 domain-containing protein [Nocardiopsis dassonvillei]ASU58382.1 DUF397 domain-containing protein [Nocardiopsis dassonvillei]
MSTADRENTSDTWGDWKKSSYSGRSGGDCVEARDGKRCAVRDTAHRSLGALEVSAGEWNAVLASLKKR